MTFVPGWVPREPPLAPAAVLARGPVVPALSAATRDRLDRGASLRVAMSEDWLVVLGTDLPWADGVTYLGWDGGLLVPTTLACTLPADLLRAALLRRIPPGYDLVVVVGDDVLASPAPVRPAYAAALP